MSATGVLRVQTRERRRWNADSYTRCRHRRQTFTSPYHHRARSHSPSPKLCIQSPKINGRQRENTLRRESSSRMCIGALGKSLQVSRITKKPIRHREQEAYLGHWELRLCPPWLGFPEKGRSMASVDELSVMERVSIDADVGEERHLV